MRSFFSSLGAAVVFAVASGAGAQDASPVPYVLESGGTVQFECQGPEVTRAAHGRFGVVTSRLSLDPTSLARATGQVEVLLTSITTDDSAWDELFRRAPFLALEEHPRARFDIEHVRGRRALRPNTVTQLTIQGRFTVHGVARPMTMQAEVTWVPAEGPTPERIEVRGTFAFEWVSHEIPVPTGHTRTFAGDGARVTVALTYTRPPTPVGRH